MNLHFSGLCKSYKDKNILKDVSGKINIKDKIGLVGANGIGKTTLAKIIAGKESFDSGEIKYSPGQIKVLYVEQYPIFSKDVSVYEEILRVAQKNSYYNQKEAPILIKKLLNEVDLKEEKWQLRAINLSGGEKTKLSLAKAIISDFDFLILDEPTNHLDLESYRWFEEYLQNLIKPMLIISHDRLFLDRVVNKIWELTPKGLKEYEGNYSVYRREKEIQENHIAKEYAKQQIKIGQLKEVIDERKGWYKKAHKKAGQNDFYRSKAKKHANVLKAKERELERLEKNKIDKPEKSIFPAFEVINKGISGKKLPPFLIQGEHLTKNYGEKSVFNNISFAIKRGDKIALLGKNGVGKTTLLKTICGLEKDYLGKVTINPTVKIGYFAQELENLQADLNILDDVLTEGVSSNEARLLLSCLLFRGDSVFKKISNLSMGERGRVAFAKLILSGANLLILDELTNYMDIESQEKIEEVLEEFTGTILFVSHDRYFIKRIANKIFILENLKLICYDGDYEYYLSKLKEKKLQESIGEELGNITDNINRLECELAFLSGRLNDVLDEKEKEELNKRFFATAKELNNHRKIFQKK